MSIDLINIFFVLIFITPYVIIISMHISRKRQSTNTKNIEDVILTLNNEINKMRTESEWRSEIQSQGKF